MPSVSAVVLTRNSQRTIERCIKALLPAVDYVTVVDTGSTDNTVQIAKDCGARVYHFEWRDDFSAARNFGDSLATTDWVIHVDSDEILREEDAPKLRKLCVRFNKTPHPVQIAIHQINIMPNNARDIPVSRMYKRGVLVWKGIIHEQLEPKRGYSHDMLLSDIGVIHDGYNSDVTNHREKVRTRNIPLLQRGVEMEPNNVAYHYFLGRDLSVVGEYEKAIPHLKMAIELMERQNKTLQLENARKRLDWCLEMVSPNNRVHF